MKKIFVNSDILLDVVLERKPFFYDSQKIIAIIEKNLFQGFTSSLIIANCFYIVSTNKNSTIA